MSLAVPHVPRRLRAAGATDLELRLLRSAAREQPSRELSERMAAGIGIAVPMLLVASNPTLSQRVPAPRAAFSLRASWPLFAAAALVAFAVAAVVVVEVQSGRSPPAAKAPAAAPRAVARSLR